MINPVRGEAKVRVGDVEIVLAATMDGLARLSADLRCLLWGELYRRLAGGELAAVRTAIAQFAISGTRGDKRLNARQAAEAALAAMTLSDIDGLTAGFIAIFAAMTREEPQAEKNGGAGAT